MALLEQDEDLGTLFAALRVRYGDSLRAVLLYGSYTRGERDTLIDLYVLTEGPVPTAALPHWQRFANRILAPNVYQLGVATGARCKYALVPLAAFERHLREDFHSYFWARFAQPCQVLYVADAGTATRLVVCLANAVRRMLTEAQRGMPHCAPTPQALWQHALSQTYRCELRAESGLRAGQLVERDHAYFVQLAQAWSAEQPRVEGNRSSWPLAASPGGWRWPARRLWGKALSVARLLKAAFTFNDGFEYLLWKIERHSGIYVEPTPLQRRWPLLFAWPLFWRLYRLGAFR
ncbi:MAG: hypothetical protein AAGA68_14955 [Pseudomonadota bacterium]